MFVLSARWRCVIGSRAVHHVDYVNGAYFLRIRLVSKDSDDNDENQNKDSDGNTNNDLVTSTWLIDLGFHLFCHLLEQCGLQLQKQEKNVISAKCWNSFTKNTTNTFILISFKRLYLTEFYLSQHVFKSAGNKTQNFQNWNFLDCVGTFLSPNTELYKDSLNIVIT